jgi:glycosyltransferase 2 family protein
MKRSLRICLNVARALLGLGLVAFIVHRTQGWDVAKPVLAMPWLAAGLVGLGFFGVGIEAARLKMLMGGHDVDLPFWSSYRIVMIGTFFNVCIPGGTGGDVMKLYYLAQANRGRGVEVAMVLLVDRVVALFSMLILICAFAVVEGALVWRLPAVLWMSAAAGALAVALFAVAALSCSRRMRANRAFNWCLDHLPLSAYLHRAVDALHDFRGHTSRLVAGVLVSLAGHSALALMFYFMGKEIMPGAGGLSVCLLSFLGILANVVPLTPGGLGVGEAAFEKLFALAGYRNGAVLLVIWRLASVPLILLGGVHYMLGLGVRRAPAASVSPALAANAGDGA